VFVYDTLVAIYKGKRFKKKAFYLPLKVY